MTETAQSQALADLRNRHLAFYIDSAHRAEEGMDGEDQTEWIEFFTSEQENFRSALRWAIDSGQADAAMELAALLTPFWLALETYTEARQWLGHVLSMPGASVGARARACSAMGETVFALGDYDESVRRSDEAARLFEEAGDAARAAVAETQQGWALWYGGKVSESGPLFESAADALRGSVRADWLESALRGLGWYQLSLGNNSGAVAFHDEGRRVLEQSGNRRWLLGHLGPHAVMYQNIGDDDAMRRVHEEALGIARELGDTRLLLFPLEWLVRIKSRAPGELAEAEELAAEWLRLAREASDPVLTSEALEAIGGIAARHGDRDRSRTVLREALDQSHRIRDVTPVNLTNRAAILAALATLDILEGRRDEARRLLDEAKPLVRLQSAGPWTGGVLLQIGRLYEYVDTGRAVATLKEALAGFQALEDKRWASVVRAATVELSIAEGRPSDALPHAKADFDKAREAGRRFEVADTGERLASLFYARGEYETARSTLNETLAGESDVTRLASLRALLAAASVDDGDVDAAERTVTDIGPDWRTLRSPRALARLLEAVGKIAAARGRPADAARMLGAAESYRRLVGMQRDTHEIASFARAIDAVRSALGETEFTTTFDAGGAIGFDDALAKALG